MDKVFSILEFEGDGYSLLCSTMSENIAYEKAISYVKRGVTISIELYKNGEYVSYWDEDCGITLEEFLRF